MGHLAMLRSVRLSVCLSVPYHIAQKRRCATAAENLFRALGECHGILSFPRVRGLSPLPPSRLHDM